MQYPRSWFGKSHPARSTDLELCFESEKSEGGLMLRGNYITMVNFELVCNN